MRTASLTLTALAGLLCAAPLPQLQAEWPAGTAQHRQGRQRTAQRRRAQLPQGDAHVLPGAAVLDINTATKQQLTSLPGVSIDDATRIINERPYASPTDLLTKGILPAAEYRRIASRVTTAKQH